MNIAKDQVQHFLNEVELFFTESQVRDQLLLSTVNHSLTLLERQLNRGLFGGNYELLKKVQKLREKINFGFPPEPLPLQIKASQKEKERFMTEAIAFNASMEDLSTQYNFQNKVSGAGFLSDRKRFAKKRSQSWHLMTRGLGLFQCFGGATQAVAGVAGGIVSFETGVGPVLAAAFATMGADIAVAGCSAVWTGEYQQTGVNKGLHSLGFSDNQSDIAEVIANLGFFMGPLLIERTLTSPAGVYVTEWGINSVKNIRLQSKELEVMARQERMLLKNAGYNLSPESWFSEYPSLGREGTFVTDYKAIAEELGPVKANVKYDVSFFSNKNTVSYYRLLKIEKKLGLEPGTLKGGFRFTRISKIQDLHPRSPLEGNRFFVGPGKGLPGKGPEIVVDSVKTNPWPPKNVGLKL